LQEKGIEDYHKKLFLDGKTFYQEKVNRAGFNAKKEYWESYDQMNVMISNSFDS
jgi:hypothetical protein